MVFQCAQCRFGGLAVIVKALDTMPATPSSSSYLITGATGPEVHLGTSLCVTTMPLRPADPRLRSPREEPKESAERRSDEEKIGQETDCWRFYTEAKVLDRISER
ncbi:unnamed protein product [Polarella glacialis]|uniref:Uncharacterized protein n=1 Tax=Polarella glacialis TaxID=89957 RepID=A0A813J6L5_POLGL|nr:unnamed protein product [Polarella glacialis]